MATMALTRAADSVERLKMAQGGMAHIKENHYKMRI